MHILTGTAYSLYRVDMLLAEGIVTEIVSGRKKFFSVAVKDDGAFCNCAS